MDRKNLFHVLLLAGLLSCGPLVWAGTAMVAVQIEFSQKVISPDATLHARQLANDLEGCLMDRLFEEGQVTFNAPTELHLLEGETANSLVENLLSLTRNGGGSLLVLCRLALSEPVPNQILEALSCSLSVIPLKAAVGQTRTWTIPVKPGTPANDLKAVMVRLAAEVAAIAGKTPDTPDSRLAIGLRD
jgi:hypothetical protein